MPKDPDFGSTGRMMEEKIDVVEKGLNTHIRGMQIGRRGFLKVIAGLGAAATTLALPSALNIGNDDIKPLIRKVEARKTDKPPYEVPGPYERFNYDLRNIVMPKWFESIGENMTEYGKKMMQINNTKLEQGVTGYRHQDQVFQNASWTFNGLINEHSQLRNVVGGRGTGAGSWEPLFAYNPRGDVKWEAGPAEAAKVVKKAARFFQADIVGTCNIDKRWVFSRQNGRDIVFEDVDQPYETDEKLVIPEKCKWAVVMGVEMDPEAGRVRDPDNLSTHVSLGAVGLGYSRQAIIHTMVAEFIRGLGYLAIPQANDTSLSIPFAIDAGLAQLGRNGLAITPEYGPQVRWSKVFTDLPLEPDKWTNFGVTQFCTVCKKCCRTCPSGAISDGSMTTEPPYPEKTDDDMYYLSFNNPGVRKWYVHHSMCRKMWIDGGAPCDICQQTCPFSKRGEAWPHGTARWFIENVPALNSLWVWVDDALGYGAGITAEEWWENRPVTWAHGTRRPRVALRPNHEP